MSIVEARGEASPEQFVDVPVKGTVTQESKIGFATDRPPYEVVKDMLVKSAIPRRPNRNKPIHSIELAAWDDASDEVWRDIE